jgi:hypothetical protein
MSDHDPYGDESFMYPDRRDRPEPGTSRGAGHKTVVEQPRIIDNYKDSSGTNWDLNDPQTYESEYTWFPVGCRNLDASGLDTRIQHEIGWSLYYMLCCHPGWDQRQYDRVMAFGLHYARESREPDRRNNVPWRRKQLFLILDETENQC